MTKDGLPRAIGPLVDLLRSSSPDNIRFSLTLLNISKIIEWWPEEADLTSIRDDSPVSDNITDTEVHQALRRLGVTSFDARWCQFHLTTKSGPFGQALRSAVGEIYILPKSLIEDLKVFADSEDFNSHIDYLLNLPEECQRVLSKMFNPKGSQIFRRLSLVRDPEAKLRPIAILDYWSQTALKPLHDEIFKKLKRIITDCTFEQVAKLPDRGPYYSLDLTAATDRFPVQFQIRVLSLLMGKERAEAWGRILTQYEFGFPMGSNPSNEKFFEFVKYGRGQPMGAYSSWAVFTLCHHIVVQIAAGRTGINRMFRDYALLGDDIVIANRKVALAYISLMSELGVEISEHKSHVSMTHYEFAKRWFANGVELSGIPIPGLMEARSGYLQLYAFIRTLTSRGFEPQGGIGNPGVSTSFHNLLGIHPEHVQRISKKYMMLHYVTEIVEGNTHYFKQFAGLLGLQVPCHEGTQAKLVAYLVAQGLAPTLVAEVQVLLSEKGAVFRLMNREYLDSFIRESNKALKLPDPGGLDFQSIQGQLGLTSWPILNVLDDIIAQREELMAISALEGREGLNLLQEPPLAIPTVTGLFSARSARQHLVAKARMSGVLADVLIKYTASLRFTEEASTKSNTRKVNRLSLPSAVPVDEEFEY